MKIFETSHFKQKYTATGPLIFKWKFLFMVGIGIGRWFMVSEIRNNGCIVWQYQIYWQNISNISHIGIDNIGSILYWRSQNPALFVVHISICSYLRPCILCSVNHKQFIWFNFQLCIKRENDCSMQILQNDNRVINNITELL